MMQWIQFFFHVVMAIAVLAFVVAYVENAVYETTQHATTLLLLGVVVGRTTARGVSEVGCFRGTFLCLFGMVVLGVSD